MFEEFKKRTGETIEAAQNLQKQLLKLQNSAVELQDSLSGIERYAYAVNHALNLWQFKNESRLTKIQKILERYDSSSRR